MRWFKHMTHSGDDEKLSLLMDAAGLEGYGFWWRVVEIVASKVDDKGNTDVTFPTKKWGDLLGISAKKFEKLAEICASFEIFQTKKSENSITVNIPNILKFRDEYQSSRLDVSLSEWRRIRAEIFKRDNGVCQYCGTTTKKPDCDHIVPLSKGGTSVFSNLATACQSCNRSKGARTPEEWLQ